MYKCEICNYVAKTKRGLINHKNAMYRNGHSNHRLIKKIKYCLICGREMEYKKYCSKNCYGQAISKGIALNCPFVKGHKYYPILNENDKSRKAKDFSEIISKKWKEDQNYINNHKEGSKKQSLKLKKKYETGELTPWNKGLTKETDERVAKYGFQKMGENHPFWIKDRTLKYDQRFDEDTKQEIFYRDNFKCQLCGGIKRLCPHHIDYNKNHSYPTNLITLCRSCNVKVNYNRSYWTEYFQDYMLKSGKIKNLTMEFIRDSQISVPENTTAVINVLRDY